MVTLLYVEFSVIKNFENVYCNTDTEMAREIMRISKFLSRIVMIQRDQLFLLEKYMIVLIWPSCSTYEYESVFIHWTNSSTAPGTLITQITQFHCKFENLHHARNSKN